MAAFTALAIAGAVGSMAYGAYEANEGKKQQEAGLKLQQQGYQVEQQAAQQQAGIYKEQAASSVQYAAQERGINQLASAQSIAASQSSQAINADTIRQEQALQALQFTAMTVDARRQQVQSIRDQQRARAVSLATGVSQGGSGFVGQSSARGGAYGQISGQTAVNIADVNTNLAAGIANYGLNQNISQNKLQMNDLETQYAIQQVGIQNLKSDLQYGYAQVNAGYQTRLADTQTLMSQGQGLVNQGGGQAALGQSQVQAGNSFISAGANIFSMGTNANQLMGSNFSLPNFNFLFGGGSPTGY